MNKHQASQHHTLSFRRGASISLARCKVEPIWELQDEEPVSAGCDVDAILWPSASAAKLGSQLNHLLKTAEIHPKECGLLDLASRKVRCVALLLRRAAATR